MRAVAIMLVTGLLLACSGGDNVKPITATPLPTATPDSIQAILDNFRASFRGQINSAQPSWRILCSEMRGLPATSVWAYLAARGRNEEAFRANQSDTDTGRVVLEECERAFGR